MGRVLVVVDQSASIAALPVAVARACGHQVAYLPGLAMRRIADLHPGNAKTDARDAYVIADAARTLPHTLRRVDTGDETLAELQVLVGYDDDLAGEATRLANRIRGLLTQIHPPLERALGPKIQHPAVLELLSRCGGPAGLRAAGRRQLTTIALTRAPRMGARLVEAVLAALDEQTVTVPGTTAAETILPRLADSLPDVLRQRDHVAGEVEGMLDDHPLVQVLTSMPGVGVRTCARILLEIGDASAFATPGHWPPTPAWPRSPAAPAARSAVSTHPAAATSNSNARSSSPRSLPSHTPNPGPTTTANEPKASVTTPPSSAWPADAATCCTPCSATRRSTAPTPPTNSPPRLDRPHRDTPGNCPNPGARRTPQAPPGVAFGTQNVFEKLIDGRRVGMVESVDASTVDRWRGDGGTPRT
jgi:transposase